jgi:hypothetical protein
MKFDNAATCEEVIWDMRIAEQPRATDRATLLRLYNGAPPFDDATAEENNIQINVNDLSGVNILSQARRQWNGAFLKPSNFFIARPDFGKGHKRAQWSQHVTRHANRLLKRDRRMIGQVRATGANTILFGIGPTNWPDRKSVVPHPIPVSSLLVPSETEIDDFDNLSYFAIFREWTAAKLYEMTHGPKVDPGWNMKLVNAQMDFIKDELRKSPNSLAYQYMPERIEELIKQDKGYFGSDAVPTVDVWDFYFREAENGKGWYRRVLMDWGSGAEIKTMPTSRNKVGNETQFLYSSGRRKYADSLSEILHCQFGDCSVYAPFKYHSIRSLGWMLWGVCELQNRLHCKFNEAVFEQLMWFFQTASNQDMQRLKKASFEHMGIIPQGIRFLTADERFTPNPNLMELAFSRNQKLMADNSTTYTQDYSGTRTGDTARTATETMAIVNSSQALATGILEMAYTYESFKYREMLRRLMLKGNPDKTARDFRLACLNDGVPEDMLEVDKWTIDPEQVIGGGNKTLQMATVGFLNSIRKNLPPDGQRLVDHISVEAATDQPDLAEDIAPIGENQPISASTHNAQLATERILRGLPFTPPKDAVAEDYIMVWLQDMGLIVKNIMQQGGMGKPEDITGLMNLGQHIGGFLQILALNEDEKEKVKAFQDLFGQLMNHVKAFAQRLQEAMQQQQAGQPGADPEVAAEQARTAAKIQSQIIQAQAKADNMRESHAQRTEQKQISWEKQEERKDAETEAKIVREGAITRHELMANRLKTLSGE